MWCKTFNQDDPSPWKTSSRKSQFIIKHITSFLFVHSTKKEELFNDCVGQISYWRFYGSPGPDMVVVDLIWGFDMVGTQLLIDFSALLVCWLAYIKDVDCPKSLFHVPCLKQIVHFLYRWAVFFKEKGIIRHE